MSWAVGYDSKWQRDIGYRVPSICDHPKCNKEIHRGLSYVCGSEAYGGANGCGLFFCDNHLGTDTKHNGSFCENCINENGEVFTPTQDTDEWTNHKLTHPSWSGWRKHTPKTINDLSKQIDETNSTLNQILNVLDSQLSISKCS